MSQGQNRGPRPSRPLDARIQELEALTVEIGAESRSTRADVEKLARSFDRFSEQVSRWMQTAGRPNWGWFIGGGGLILSIMGLAAQPFVRDQVEMGMDIRMIQRDRAADAPTRWKRGDQETYADKTLRVIDAGDTRGILEVRAVEERLDEQIHDLATRYQEHISNGHPHTVLDKLGALEKTLDEARAELSRRGEWMTETTVGLAERDAGFEARLADLEREIREISSEQRRRTEKVYQ